MQKGNSSGAVDYGGAEVAGGGAGICEHHAGFRSRHHHQHPPHIQ